MSDTLRGTLLLSLARGGSPLRPPPVAADVLLHGKRADLAAADIRGATIERLLHLRRAGEPDRELERAAKAGVRVLLPGERGYPCDLARHPAAPPLLYARGGAVEDPPPPPRAGIVGARNATRAMERFAGRLASSCAHAGVPVVSGLARGIDAAAHEAFVAHGGRAIGVLGAGVDVAYPSTSRRLHDRVAAEGVLFSTFPLGSEPRPFQFPLRNRIVAALAEIVVVVQAAEDSGTMSTARAALDFDTLVGAVPGSPDDPLARGTNRLIRDGAIPILEPADLLDPLLGVGRTPLEERHTSPRLEPGPAERVLREIASTPLTPDELAFHLRLPFTRVLELLLQLEVDGRVERLPGQLYVSRGR